MSIVILFYFFNFFTFYERPQTNDKEVFCCCHRIFVVIYGWRRLFTFDCHGWIRSTRSPTKHLYYIWKKIPIRHFDSRNRVLLGFHLNIQSVWVHHIKTRDTHLHRCSHCTAFTKTPELWPPGPPAPLGAISHNYTWRRKLLLSHWTQLLSGSQRCSHLQAITHLPSPVAWNTHTRSTTSNLTPTEEPFYLQTPLCQAAAGQLFS